MKVSIITAAKNAAATISDTLRSIEDQDFANIEHVVVDGCSTDQTLTIVRRGSRVANVVSARDSGVYGAFNRGLSLISGDVVAFLNADDFYSSADVISTVVSEFVQHNADIVFGDVLLVRFEDPRATVRYYSSKSFVPSRLARGFMPAHPAMFVRRALYEQLGGFDTSFKIAGDFDWTARAFGCPEAIRYRHLDRILVRMREGGISTRGPLTTLRITREIRRACAQHGIRTNYLKLLSRLPEKLLEYVTRPASNP